MNYPPNLTDREKFKFDITKFIMLGLKLEGHTDIPASLRNRITSIDSQIYDLNEEKRILVDRYIESLNESDEIINETDDK